MKSSFVKIACATALLGSAAFAQVSTSETNSTTTSSAGGTVSQSTTTTTEGSGTITSFEPGTSIVLKESSGPRTYRYGKTVTYVTKSGKAISDDEVKTRIRVGIPVHVSYAQEGDSYVVNRVVVDE
ncbi:MAG: hypothetical protein ABIT76_14735 [Chthoniobacterales bacterium]